MPTPNSQQRQAIEAEIFTGNKIGAIKLYREATREGLKEAKEAVEALEAEMRQRSPERFAAGAKKTGCLSVVMLVVVALVTIYIWRS